VIPLPPHRHHHHVVQPSQGHPGGNMDPAPDRRIHLVQGDGQLISGPRRRLLGWVPPDAGRQPPIQRATARHPGPQQLTGQLLVLSAGMRGHRGAVVIPRTRRAVSAATQTGAHRAPGRRRRIPGPARSGSARRIAIFPGPSPPDCRRQLGIAGPTPTRPHLAHSPADPLPKSVPSSAGTKLVGVGSGKYSRTLLPAAS
jgi:hypothetical protein